MLTDTGRTRTRGYAAGMSRSRATVGLGLSAIASIGVAAYMSGRRAVPSFSGTRTLPILDSSAEVLRDTWGVPAVFASTSADAYRIQGWLHATDRTFQMDLLRHVGTGRLAELVGDKGIGPDRLIRTLGFHRMVEKEWQLVDGDTRAGLEAYAEGVNAGFARMRRKLPVEFRLLGRKPEPWRPQDCLVLGRIMALSLCGNWESELARGEIATAFGTDVLDALEPGGHAASWPAQIHEQVLGEVIAAARDATSSFGNAGGTGSNNWVIGPRRTRDGGAILANDPHLDLALPSVWYEQRLAGGDLDVRGFTFPGVPGIVVGHNGRIAWGFTNSSIDVQDTYLEELDEAGKRYRDVGGEWRDLQCHTERICVKGGEDFDLEVRATRRGPIITDAAASGEIADPVSLRWDSVRPAHSARTLHELNRATDWESFREATRGWLAPPQNVVYADSQGNIGFQHMGEVPVRASGNDGTVPRRGDDPAGEWVSVIPWEEMPHSFNPSSGRIVTANDRIVGDDYPYFMSRDWMNGYRGERIRSLIDSVEGHTVEDQVGIQTDIHSLPGMQLRGLLERLTPEPATEAGAEVLRELLAWDGELRAGTDASAAWRLAQRALQDETFGFLGDMLPRFLGYSRTGVGGFWALFSKTTPMILGAIDTDDESLLRVGRQVQERRDAAGGTDSPMPAARPGWEPHASWRALLAAALDRAGHWWSGEHTDEERSSQRSLQHTAPGPASRAVGSVNERMDAKLMRRRRYHRVRLQHPLGIVPGFARVANRGPFHVPGDPDTVWQTSSFNNPSNDYSLVGPSHRNIVNMADVDRSAAVLCGGQSGHPASPHYADQIGLWRKGEVRPAPFTRPAIERQVRYTQRFVP